jgi:hypothetical protein
MSAVSLVVYERTQRWAPELKRRFRESDVIVRGCSTPRDVLSAVADGAAVAVLVLDGLEAQCLEIVGQFAVRTTCPVVIAIANEDGEDLEWPLRELGTTSVLSHRTTSDELLAVCNRMLADRC